MFEPLRIERVPSRLLQDSSCVAFARHPNTSATTVSNSWGSCTVTSKIDLIFHRGEGDAQDLQIPGSVEKKKRTPHFFRLSCNDASLVQGYPISSHQVISFSFSECSHLKVEKIHGESAAIARSLPTIALLLHVSSAEMNLLLLRPTVRAEGKVFVIRYSASVHPTPIGIRHVVVTRCGRAVFLFGQYISEFDGQIQCCSCSISDSPSQVLFQSIHMSCPITSTTSTDTSTNPTPFNAVPISPVTTRETAGGGSSQSVVWVGVRKPFQCGRVISSNQLEVELTILTNCALAMVFHVCCTNIDGSTSAMKRNSATCTWTTRHIAEPFHIDGGDDVLLQNPLSLLKRWKTTASFARALKEESTLAEYLLYNPVMPVHHLSSSTTIVRGSPNGAIICVIVPNTHEAFLIGLGSTPSVNVPGEVTTAAIAIPPTVRIVDAIWVTGPLLGFLLLGTCEDGDVAKLFFLPLTGDSLLCVHVDDSHHSFLAHKDGTLTFFSYGVIEDVFGAMQLRLSLMYRQHGDAEVDVKEVRTGLVSLPGLACVSPLRTPLHVLRLVFLTSLASFASLHDSSVGVGMGDGGTGGVPAGANTQPERTRDVNDVSLQGVLSLLNGKEDVQLATELMIEAQLDPWLRAGTVGGVFPLRDLLREIFAQLLDDLQRTSHCAPDSVTVEANKALVTRILSVFRGVAESLEAISLTSSRTLLQHYISDIHALIISLRQAITLLGQCGAISACFTSVAYFTKAIDSGACASKDHMSAVNAPLEYCSPQWRVLIAPLFDDALALLSSCSSLSHVLLPYCSRPLQQLMMAREWVRNPSAVVVTHTGEGTRALEEVLALARRGTAGLAMLSVADVCCTARRLFFRDGVEAARAFLATVTDTHMRSSREVNDLYMECKAVDKELTAIPSCI